MIVILVFLGIITGFREFVLAAIIPSIIIVLNQVSRTPKTDDLEIERKIETGRPNPGQKIKIKLKIRNNGSRTLKELRIVDLVPDSLKVVSGSPRGSISLTSGSSKTLEYSVIARRGNHVFKGARIEIPSGPKSIIEEKSVEGSEEIECKTELSEIALRDRTIEMVGDIKTRQGGSGIEFHSLRDYESRDPMSRVEWRHLAKTGELATKKFREEKTGNIILVIDFRKISDKKPVKGVPTGSELSAYAAKGVYKALKESRHNPGIVVAGINVEELEVHSDSSKIPYIKPGQEKEKEQRAERLIKSIQQAERTEESDLRNKLYELAPPNTQFIFFSPLLDSRLVQGIEILEQHGHPSMVVSPDITVGGTMAADLMSLKRGKNIKEVEKSNPVVDWDPRDPMNLEVPKILKKAYIRDV